MRTSLFLLALASLLLGLLIGCAPNRGTNGATKSDAKGADGKEPYVIGAVFDKKGNGAPLGEPEWLTVEMLVEQINAEGGVDGHPLVVKMEDNESDSVKSLTAVTKLIESDKVLAIIGSSQTATTLSAADAVQTAKVPMVSCAAGVAIVQPVKPYIFKTAQSDVHAVAKVIEYLTANKLSKIAIITVSNPFGDSGKKQLELQAKAANISIVTAESFAPDATDMSAQLTRIRKANPQAIVCWGTNPGPALIAKNMQTLGMKQPLVMSHGIANKKFIELAGTAANGIIFPAGKLLVAADIADTDPQKKVLLEYTAAYKAKYGKDADTFGGHAYDALHIIVKALKEAGPDRDKIRAALEKMEFVGISGPFKFTADDHNGLQQDAFVMVKIVDGKWTLVK